MKKSDAILSYNRPSKIVVFLLAFFLGVFGIHDFAIGRTREGLIHLLLLPVICFCSILMSNLSFISLQIVILAVNWVWAIVEAIQYRPNEKVYYRKTSSQEKTLARGTLERKINTTAKLAIFLNMISAISMILYIVSVSQIEKDDLKIELIAIFTAAVFIVLFLPTLVLDFYAYLSMRPLVKSKTINPRKHEILQLANVSFIALVVAMAVFAVVWIIKNVN